MSSNTAELMNQGMKCLIEHLGDVRAEEFIAVIRREQFDYTKWRRQLFDGTTASGVNEAAAEYAEENPW